MLEWLEVDTEANERRDEQTVWLLLKSLVVPNNLKKQQSLCRDVGGRFAICKLAFPASAGSDAFVPWNPRRPRQSALELLFAA